RPRDNPLRAYSQDARLGREYHPAPYTFLTNASEVRTNGGQGRRTRAGTPATTDPAATSRVTTAPAPTSARAPMRMPPSTTAPEPIDAPRSTTGTSSDQSSSDWSAPDSDVARGVLSFTNITPWPTKTSSSIVTPSQMNVWLWILQRAPTAAPRSIPTNRPRRVSSPLETP